MTTPGTHLAVHTGEALLSTGAWMDCSQHINTLVLRGVVDEARTLCRDQCLRWYTWELTPPPLCLSPGTCHQFEECPVAKPPASDVKQVGEGSNSLSLECGCLGSRRRNRRGDLGAISCYPSGRALEDFIPPKIRGFDPKPWKNAGSGPLVSHIRITAPLGIQYTYDI